MVTATVKATDDRLVNVSDLKVATKAIAAGVNQSLEKKLIASEEKAVQSLSKKLQEMTSPYEQEVKELKQQLETQRKDFEKKLSQERDSHRKQLDDVYGRFTKEMGLIQVAIKSLPNMDGAVQSGLDWVVQMSKALETRFSSMILEEISKVHSKIDRLESIQVDRFKTLETAYSDQIAAMEKTYSSALDNMLSLVKALPTPQVVLPEASIQIVQSTPIVNLPSEAIKIEQAKVEINVPQQAAPQVTVETPKPRNVEKTIQYDQNGYPVHIVEREVGNA